MMSHLLLRNHYYYISKMLVLWCFRPNTLNPFIIHFFHISSLWRKPVIPHLRQIDVCTSLATNIKVHKPLKTSFNKIRSIMKWRKCENLHSRIAGRRYSERQKAKSCSWGKFPNIKCEVLILLQK